MRWIVGSMVALGLFGACAAEETGEQQQPAVVDLAPLNEAPTTLERTLVPVQARLSKIGDKNPALPGGMASYPPDMGDLKPGPGEPHQARTLDGSAPPAAGPSPRRLVRFAHLADLQLPDDESPTRLGNFDAPSPLDAALRLNDAEICRMTNAAVRTINVLHRKEAVDFVLLGGDNTDSAQSNELDWLMGILGGGQVECDSGANDDLIPGPGNDGKDPFTAEGLKMPWRWVTGNHDVLVQGTLPVNAQRKMAVVGSEANSGTRDYSQGGAVVKEVVPDERRALLDRKEMMTRVAGAQDGHGLGAAQAASGKAFYHFDVPDTPLRFVILDTGAEAGGADGMLHQADVDAFVKPALDEARAQGKWVILASHHASGALTSDGGSLGVEQPDALLPDAWRSFLGGYGNVVFSMVAHSHRHGVEAIQPAQGAGFWEVKTASIADYPHQFRMVEVWDQDNGWLMLRATCVDLATEGDAVAAEGRRRGVIDALTGWGVPEGEGKLEERNVELYLRKPEAAK